MNTRIFALWLRVSRRVFALCCLAIPVVAIAGCRHDAPHAAPAPTPVATQPAPLALETKPSPTRVILATAEVRIPLGFVTGVPYIQWKGDDGTDARLLVDTGADRVLLSPRLAAAWHLTTRETGNFTFDSSGQRIPTRLARVPWFSLGPVRFEEFDAVVTDLHIGGDGLLGWPLFKDLLLTIDYANRAMLLKAGELPPPDGKDVLPLKLESGRLLIPVVLDGAETFLQLDTGWGNGGNIELTIAQADKMKWASPLAAVGSGNTPLGSVVEKLGRLQGEVRLGRHVLSQPVAGVNPGNKIGLLGALTLQNFKLTLDVKNLRVRLERDSNEPIRTPSVFVAGFNCDLRQEPLKVIEVLPGSEAERAGLKVDDLIETINAQPPLAGLLSNTGNSMTLDLRRGDQKIHLNVPLTKLVP